MNWYEKYKVNIPEGVSGNCKIVKFIVSDDSFERVRLMFEGRDCQPGEYTKLLVNNGLMMSDTPAEIKDHLGFIGKATGSCLINGLGLGVVLKALIDNPEVTAIDVVEKEQDVINLVWPTYKDCSKVSIHLGDAYTILWPKEKHWECAWHDIWPDIYTDNLEGITKLKRKYARKVNWQMAWVEDLLRYKKRQENRYY